MVYNMTFLSIFVLDVLASLHPHREAEFDSANSTVQMREWGFQEAVLPNCQCTHPTAQGWEGSFTPPGPSESWEANADVGEKWRICKAIPRVSKIAILARLAALSKF